VDADREIGTDYSTMSDGSSGGIRSLRRQSARNIIAGQLKGEMHFDWRGQGLACEIILPLAEAGRPEPTSSRAD
jgi:hypothetical protein